MTLLLMGVLVLQFGSISILAVEEHAEGANITSASDALWYTLVTISTVGYGDQYPVTNAGRLIGTLVIIVGVGIFGTFTGYLANLFLGPRKGDENAEADAEALAVSDVEGDSPAEAAPPSIAVHAAKGVAAGAVAGAVRHGVAARDAETEDTDAPGAHGVPAVLDEDGGPAAASVSGLPTGQPDDTAERVRVLLAQSEQAMAEVRRLLADATP
jgi:hypothetical protein